MSPHRSLFAALSVAATALAVTPAAAQTLSNITYDNGFTVPGATQDLAGANSSFNRLGMFSDIYNPRNRNEWWGLADRGPGGGVLSYDTRMERFTIDINGTTGAISNVQVVQTVLFKSQGVPLNGLAPSPTNVLGNVFDPEGVVVNPLTGNFIGSDEYGPTVYEVNRSGDVVKTFKTPDNIVPRNTADVPKERRPNRPWWSDRHLQYRDSWRPRAAGWGCTSDQECVANQSSPAASRRATARRPL